MQDNRLNMSIEGVKDYLARW